MVPKLLTLAVEAWMPKPKPPAPLPVPEMMPELLTLAMLLATMPKPLVPPLPVPEMAPELLTLAVVAWMAKLVPEMVPKLLTLAVMAWMPALVPEMVPVLVLVTVSVPVSLRPMAPPDRNMELVQVWPAPVAVHCCACADEPGHSGANAIAAPSAAIHGKPRKARSARCGKEKPPSPNSVGQFTHDWRPDIAAGLKLPSADSCAAANYILIQSPAFTAQHL